MALHLKKIPLNQPKMLGAKYEIGPEVQMRRGENVNSFQQQHRQQ